MTTYAEDIATLKALNAPTVRRDGEPLPSELVRRAWVEAHVNEDALMNGYFVRLTKLGRDVLKGSAGA